MYSNTICDTIGSTVSSLNICPRVEYKGVEVTYDELDSLIARKQKQKPKKPKSKERIVFDGNYTIYYDKNGKKTVVSKMLGVPYDAEKAVLWALLKSKGVKPKEVMELVENAIDKATKRRERELRKEYKRNKKALDAWLAEKLSQQECDDLPF